RHGLRAEALTPAHVVGARVTVVAAGSSRDDADAGGAAARGTVERPAGEPGRHRRVPATGRCAAVLRAGVPVVAIAVLLAGRPGIEGRGDGGGIERAPAGREVVARPGGGAGDSGEPDVARGHVVEDGRAQPQRLLRSELVQLAVQEPETATPLLHQQ